MNILDKFLEKWDLEIVWTILLAAICVIGVTLVIPEDAGATTAVAQGAKDLRADELVLASLWRRQKRTLV